MNKRFASLALIATTIFCASAKNDDPVLMNVNGKDVKLSEFEYLYNKNNSQQVQKQTIDEYVEMFVTYKLKVADAEAAGIDTTAAFRSEFNGHRNELANPYLEDKSTINRLVDEAYSRMQEEVNVSHIMIHISEDPQKNKESKARLDSIRKEFKAGNGSFAELAKKQRYDAIIASYSLHHLTDEQKKTFIAELMNHYFRRENSLQQDCNLSTVDSVRRAEANVVKKILKFLKEYDRQQPKE